VFDDRGLAGQVNPSRLVLRQINNIAREHPIEAKMEAYGGRAPETFSDPVPDMVKQFVVYLYRHIRCNGL